MRTWYLAMLATLLVACGGGTTVPADTGPANELVSGVRIEIVDTSDGFQARSQDAIASYRVETSDGQVVTLDRDPGKFSHVLELTGLKDGLNTLNVLAVGRDGSIVASYQVALVVPGDILVHADRFTPGPPRREGATGEWVEQYAEPVFGNPDLTETYWICSVDVPPPFVRSPYDIIGLHRVATDSPRPGRVLLFLPGGQCNGCLYTGDETRDFRLWLANRGYEVYSLDYRVHFAPPANLAGVDIPGAGDPDLRFMAPWNGATWISDAATAIAFIKQNSQVQKIFLSGFSSGGQLTYYYACSDQGGRLGQDDLRGLIAMDGGPFQQGTTHPPDTLSAAAAHNAILAGPTSENIALVKSYGSDPGPGYYTEAFGNLTDPPFLENLLLWLVSGDPTAANFMIQRYQNNWGLNNDGVGQFTNIARGYNDLPTILAWSVLAADSYWPMAFGLDDAVITNFSGPPDGPYKVPVNAGGGLHYFDNLAQVNVPQYVLRSAGWTDYLGNHVGWKFAGIPLSSSTDTEARVLEHFGHLDTLSGTRSNEFVAQPLLEWLDRH
ncbi:MAG: hypothetical protein AB1758_11410 [Candidatus Eremiobacterota bacterium]